MASLEIIKTVGSLPPVITPNAMYLVRVGTGVLIFISDSTGTATYQATAGGLPVVPVTQAQYDALSPPDDNTFYAISG